MLLENMTWEEIRRSIDAGRLLVIPIGSLEEHGPHLPIATDVFSVLALAKLMAERMDLVIAPPLYYTYARPMRSFPGTVSVEGTTLILLIRDIVNEFLRQGFKRLLFFSGHYENLAFLQEGVQVALESYTSDPDVKVVITTWWDLVPEPIPNEIFGANWEGWSGVHASMAETSLALALNPNLVHADRIVDDKPDERLPYDVFPIPSSRIPKTGVFARTTSSSAETGARLRDIVLDKLAGLIKKEFGA